MLKYIKGSNWYRIYSDGWIEQGGSGRNTGYSTTQYFSFHKAFSNINYTVIVTPKQGGDSWEFWGKPSSTTQFATGGFHNDTSFQWIAYGY